MKPVSYTHLRYAGKAQTEEERQKYLYRFLTGNTIGLTEQNFRLGDNMYADVNNDGKLDQNDIVYLGTDDPKISFSFNVGAEWKGFDLSLVFQGAAQRTIFRTGDNNGNEICLLYTSLGFDTDNLLLSRRILHRYVWWRYDGIESGNAVSEIFCPR